MGSLPSRVELSRANLKSYGFKRKQLTVPEVPALFSKVDFLLLHGEKL